MEDIKIFGIPVDQQGTVAKVASPASAPNNPPIPQSTNPGVTTPAMRINPPLSPRYEPSNITQTATASEIQNAIREAENGQTFNLYRFYRDVILSDNHIQAEINARKLALLSQPLAIMPADKDNPDDAALALAFARAKSDCENWRDGLAQMMDSNCGWPVSVMERIMAPAKAARGKEPQLQYTLKRLVQVNHQVLCYQWAYQAPGFAAGAWPNGGNQILTPANGYTPAPYIMDVNRWEPYIKLWPINENGRIVYDVGAAQYLDPARHFTHRGHLLTGFRDNWGGPMRSILFWWLFRNLGREWFGSFMERFGTPFPVGYTDATDAAAVALLREAFDLAKKIGGLVVDEASRIELKEAMVAGGAAGHETFHNICNNEISKLITGLDASSKPAGLAAGANQMQQSVREDYRMFDQQSLAESVIKGIVEPFRDMNGLRGEIKLVWGGLSEADALAFATFLKMMKDAGWTPSDQAIPTVEERTGIPFERAAVPAPFDPTMAGSPFKSKAGLVKEDDEDPITDQSSQPRIPFTVFSATGREHPTPIDPIVAAHAAALAQAFRGALAPVRQIVMASSSREECLRHLKTFYADWKPQRVEEILEQALQLCAATGSVAGAKATQSKNKK